MMRGTILWTVLAVAAGIALFLLKYQVRSLEDELAALRHQIRKDKTEIHVLEAEWAYLNDPARLARLSTELLDLKPIRGEQFVSLATLPYRPPEGVAPLAEAAPFTEDGTPLPLRKPHRAAELARVRAYP